MPSLKVKTLSILVLIVVPLKVNYIEYTEDKLIITVPVLDLNELGRVCTGTGLSCELNYYLLNFSS